MPLEGELKQRLERVLAVVNDHEPRGARLEEARRLCARISMLIAQEALPPQTDTTALETACLALQLPMLHPKPALAGKSGRTPLRDRAEQAAELLTSLASATQGDTANIEETVLLLQQVYQRNPQDDQAKLLADALNLEDFGVAGLIAQAIMLGRQGGGVAQVAEGCIKREQYGYWEARLKDGFHFEQSRHLARKRLEQARKVAAILIAELQEDGAL
jgi:hypothetical protein